MHRCPLSLVPNGSWQRGAVSDTFCADKTLPRLKRKPSSRNTASALYSACSSPSRTHTNPCVLGLLWLLSCMCHITRPHLYPLPGGGGEGGRAGGFRHGQGSVVPNTLSSLSASRKPGPLGSLAASLWAAWRPQRRSPGAWGWLCPLPKIADLPLPEQDGNLKIPGASSAALHEGVTGARLVRMPSVMTKLDKV